MSEDLRNSEAASVEEVVSRSEAFIHKNKTVIIGSLAAIIILIAGIFSYSEFYKKPREAKAQAALFRGEQYFEAGQYELALNGDSLEFKGLKHVASEFSGTKAANLAHAYAGLSQAHLGNAQEAINELDNFSAEDQMIAPAIKAAMGNCYVQLGNIDKAISMLQAAASDADNNTISPVCLQQAGVLLMKQGKFDEALKAFQTVKDKYFASYQAMDVQRYIESAQIQKAQK